MTRTEIIHKRLALLAKLIDEPLTLETWAPGDGWTRYSIKKTNGNEFSYPRNYRISELEAVINAAIAAAELTLDADAAYARIDAR